MPLNILITGANSGFGLLTARVFAQAGHVVHAGYRNPDKIGGLIALRDEGHSVRPFRIDVTDNGSITEGVDAATEDAPLDVLVNNAGFEIRCPIDELSDEMAHRQFDTNVFGLIRMVRATVPAMRRRRSGMIINLSSVVGHVTFPYTGIYAASKHAVEAISEAMHLELAPFNVKVAVISPGAFDTNFGSNVLIDPSFSEASTHWPHSERFGLAFRSITNASKQDSQEVADAIFQVATSSDSKFRHLVGNDARGVVPAYRSQDFEAFSTGMLGILGIPDWKANA